MIRFTCPTCQKILKAPDEGAGRKTSCPRCGQRLLVPPPVQVHDNTMLGRPAPSVPHWQANATGAEAPPIRTPSPAAGTGRAFNCPSCNAPLLVPHAALGRMVECPQCRTTFAALREDAPPEVPQRGMASSEGFDMAEPAGIGVRSHQRNESASTSIGALFALGGGILASVGLLLLGYYWFVYDTSVPVYYQGIVPSPLGERVHNVGRMQNRLIGIIVGGGSFVVGLALYLVGLFVTPPRSRIQLIFCSPLILPLALGVFVVLRALM